MIDKDTWRYDIDCIEHTDYCRWNLEEFKEEYSIRADIDADEDGLILAIL